MRTVTVWMEGGVIHDVDLPDGITLELRDYDVEGVDLDDPRLTKDSRGDEYLKIEFLPDNLIDPYVAVAEQGQRLIERL